MIRLTRLNGSEFCLNPDLVHRAEETPDTVVTLIDGSRYVVEQSLEELLERIVAYRARVVATAGQYATGVPPFLHPVQEPDDVDDAPGAAAHDEGADVVRLRSRRA